MIPTFSKILSSLKSFFQIHRKSFTDHDLIRFIHESWEIRSKIKDADSRTDIVIVYWMIDELEIEYRDLIEPSIFNERLKSILESYNSVVLKLNHNI